MNKNIVLVLSLLASTAYAQAELTPSTLIDMVAKKSSMQSSKSESCDNDAINMKKATEAPSFKDKTEYVTMYPYHYNLATNLPLLSIDEFVDTHPKFELFPIKWTSTTYGYSGGLSGMNPGIKDYLIFVHIYDWQRFKNSADYKNTYAVCFVVVKKK